MLIQRVLVDECLVARHTRAPRGVRYFSRAGDRVRERVARVDCGAVAVERVAGVEFAGAMVAVELGWGRPFSLGTGGLLGAWLGGRGTLDRDQAIDSLA